MAIRLGPVLGFQGISNATNPAWLVGVLLVSDGDTAPELVLDKRLLRQGPSCLKLQGKFRVWRYDLQIPLTAVAQRIEYGVAGQTFAFQVPARDVPPRMAYTSCNGFSALKLMKQVADKFANWRRIAELHAQDPYQLLVMGGDQVYADPLWETIPALQSWNALPDDKARLAKFTPALRAKLENFYFDLYCTRWSEPTTAAMLASVPTLMMWDDHDIFDGWGSYEKEKHESPVFQGIFSVARDHFRTFQRQGVENAASIAPALAESVGHCIGGIGLLVLDLRTERTIDQVLSPAHWERVYTWLEQTQGLSHLIVVSSIPVMHPSFGLLEQGLGLFPGQQEIEDDLRDHWTSRGHAGERLRLIHRLLDYAGRKQVRITIVSGDVHISALGTIESRREGTTGNAQVINQLTSSGVVHPPPAGALLFALNHLFNEEEEVDRDIQGRMLKFPGTPYRFIGKRNWLSLEPDLDRPQPRIWANWYVEGEDKPYTKVIHPA